MSELGWFGLLVVFMLGWLCNVAFQGMLSYSVLYGIHTKDKEEERMKLLRMQIEDVFIDSDDDFEELYR